MSFDSSKVLLTLRYRANMLPLPLVRRALYLVQPGKVGW
jgi:hypothetical protein